MRLLLLALLLFRLSAQTAPPESKTPPESRSSLEPQQKAALPPPQEPASPALTTESAFAGSLELGYRWGSGVAGNFNSYRSVVNLGEGPKILGAEFTLLDPRKRLFDRLEARGYNWGDDPYSTLHINVRKARRYDLDVDYRNLAYFNYLPSFANPLLERGILLNQGSYDIRRRLASVRLDLLPGGRLVPYFAYERSVGDGRGITTFVDNGNEYPVPTRLRDGAADYRGGIRLELRRAHLTIEQGGTTFKDDQQVFSDDGAANPGNRETPLLGQNLWLATLRESYGIRGSGIYSKALFTVNPVTWMDLYGQFRYSLPTSDTRFQQLSTGSFWAGQSGFFTGQQFLLSAEAKLPHSSGSFGIELRPAGRLRIVAAWLTDRLHVSSSAQAQQAVTPALSAPAPPVPQSALLVTNYSQQQVDAVFDVSSKLTVRGGYRYVWGDASTSLQPQTGLANSDSAELGRHVAIAGITLRPTRKTHFSGEVEAASTGHTYFRTSLHDYQKARLRFRYQALASLGLSADFSILNNQNPLAGIHYDNFFRQSSISAMWTPGGGKRFSLQAGYTRSTVRSDLSYLAPPLFQPQRSFYRDNSHLGSALLDVAWPGEHAPRLSLGGSLVVSSGSRPTQYFQPLARASVPVSRHVTWVSEWRYYGFGEGLYQFEAFRTHLITTGIRLTR